MDTDSPRRSTKEILVQNGLESLTKRYRRELALDVLSGRVQVPARWLTPEQQAFIALAWDSTPRPKERTGGLEVMKNAVRLCDALIPALIDDYLRRHDDLSLTPSERATLRRGTGPAAVRDAIFRTCTTWPPAELERLKQPVLSAVDQALDEELRRRRMRQRFKPGGTAPTGGNTQGAGGIAHQMAAGAGDGSGLLLRPNQKPADDRDLADRETTRATSSDEILNRYIRYGWHQELRGLVKVFAWAAASVAGAVAVSALYLAIFVALRHLAPELTVREAMIVAGAAIGTSFCGTGIGLAGQVLKARARRGRRGG